jgi:hypothetical protein
MKAQSTISIDELLSAFGEVGDFSESTKKLYQNLDFSYVSCDTPTQRLIIADIERELEVGFSKVGSHREEIWESAWNQVRANFISSDLNIATLNPNFISKYDTVRWQGRYIRPFDRRIELSFFEVFRDWLFSKYLGSAENIYDSGSGSGCNIVELAQKFRPKCLVGLDWSPSAVDILNVYGSKRSENVKGIRFDLFSPDYSIRVPENTVFLTFCAFEQLGGGFHKALDFFIEKKPSLVIQMEPTLEFYQAGDPFDDIAIKYHNHRKYLIGYHTELLRLEAESRIQYINAKRLGFGSMFNECYTLHIWRPL